MRSITRSRRAHAALLVGLVALGGSSGCSHHDDGGGDTAPPASTTGAIVFGVTSDLRPGVDVDRLHSVLTTGTGSAATTDDRVVPLGGDAGHAWPVEVRAPEVPSGTPVSLRLEAWLPGGFATSPLVVRLASTRAIAGRTLLDPVRIDSSCAPPLVGGTDGGFTGWSSCAAPDTCIGGACASAFDDPASLADWKPDWNADSPDPPCKPVLGATPALAVGQGQAEYLPVSDGDVLQVEAGPQGGHHVWIAVRMKNLHGAGTRTRLTAVQPDTGTMIEPFEVIFTYDADEGGWCKLYGLRFQLDAGSVALAPLLGQTLAITATAVDSSGDTAQSTRTVRLSSTFR